MGHTFRTFLTQADQISGSAVYDDTLTMSAAETYLDKSLEKDLNYIRTQLRLITGETNWFDSPLVDLSTLDGLGLENLEQGLSGSLQNIYTFTGMDDRNDTTPTYTSTNIVSNGDNLEAAIGKLDAAVTTATVAKEVERITSPITSGSAHTVPGSHSHTAGDGSNMDIYLNGQLLQSNTGTELRDYLESGIDEVTFTFTVPTNAYLTYLIRA